MQQSGPTKWQFNTQCAISIKFVSTTRKQNEIEINRKQSPIPRRKLRLCSYETTVKNSFSSSSCIVIFLHDLLIVVNCKKSYRYLNHFILTYARVLLSPTTHNILKKPWQKTCHKRSLSSNCTLDSLNLHLIIA